VVLFAVIQVLKAAYLNESLHLVSATFECLS